MLRWIVKGVKKIIRIIDHRLFDLIFTLGLYKPTSKRGAYTILVYHGVANSDIHKYNDRFISVNLLENHIKEFKNHFNIVSVRDILESNLHDSQHNLAISFDDGYLNNFDLALPLLKTNSFPALFAITAIQTADVPILWPDYLDLAAAHFEIKLSFRNEIFSAQKKYIWSRKEFVNNKSLPLKYLLKSASKLEIENVIIQLEQEVGIENLTKFKSHWQCMSEDDIKQLYQNNLFDIASHGQTHITMNSINKKALPEEYIESKKYLESIVNQEVELFVFPFGIYDTESIELANQSGYKYFFGSEVLKNNFSNVTGRLVVNPYISTANQIRAIYNGKYG